MASSSRSSNLSTSDNRTIDNKIGADGEAVVIRAEDGNVQVIQTADEAFGLAERSFDTVDEAIYSAGSVFDQALGFASDSFDKAVISNDRALSTVAAGFDQALQESREDTTQLLSQLVLIAGIGATVYFIFGRG